MEINGGIWLAMMMGAYRAMPEEERMALEVWEAENLGEMATSDWPGWEKYIGQPPWKLGRPSKSVSMRQGHIYILRASNGLYKVGRAVDVERRLATYRTHSSEELELVGQFPAEDAVEVEAAIHSQFADKREHGEWFRLSAYDVSIILQIGREVQ